MPKSVSTRSAYKMLTCIYLCRTLLFFAPYADFFWKKISVVEQRSSLEEVENREIQYKLYSLEAFDETKFSDEDVERILHEAINRLPEQCRRIFIESKLNNKKYQDIADEMGLSLQTVKNQVMIAVRKLREDLKDCLPLLAFLLG